MTDTQIKCFIDVAESLNMSASAEHLHISQPVISRQIQALEQEFKFPLFYRRNRKLALTPSGEKMYSFFS